MSNYTDTIQHAKNLLSAILRDENQGNITFSGNDHLPDLGINHPCDLSQLRAGTVLAVNGREKGSRYERQQDQSHQRGYSGSHEARRNRYQAGVHDRAQ